MFRKILFFLLLPFLWGHQSGASLFGIPVVVVGDRVVFENNDAGEEISLPLQVYEQYSGRSHLFHPAGFYDFRKNFQEVSTHLTPILEREYEVFVLVNAAREHGHSWDYIPTQFMRVLRKSRRDQKIFIRDRQGVIIDIHQGVLGRDDEGAFGGLQGLIPISSGAGHLPVDEKGRSFVDTPAGIYRINIDKSIERRFQKGMYHSLYFDLIYPSGFESGLAIHGTHGNEYSFLGNRPSSHGCVRTTQHSAYILYEHLMSEKFMVPDLPDMNRSRRLKSELRDDSGRVLRRAGVSALFVIFYGYEGASEMGI